MPKSVFRELVKQVETDWRARFPWIKRVAVAHGPTMPKASTFYVGTANKFAKHLLLNFQHNSKAWAVGDLTVNAIFSSVLGEPRSTAARDLEPDPEGDHRLGQLVHGSDKWWSLADNGTSYGMTWRPPSYDDLQVVVSGAVEDISSDVVAFFELIEQEPRVE